MARYVKVRRQGRMVWLDKETGKTSVKKPTTPTTTTPKNKTPTKTPTNTSGSNSYNRNIKWLQDAAKRQAAAGMAPRTTPGKTQLGTALSVGAALGEAYKRTNRAPAVSNRGEGRATFTNTDKKKTEDKKTETTNTSNPRSKDSKGDTYTVGGITYSRKTGRPIKVPQNRKPVEAQDRTKKDTTSDSGGGDRTPDRTPPRNQSGSSDSGNKPKPKPKGQGSQGFRKGDKDLGKATGIRASGSKTEPAKPKSRLEKALSGIGKWEEPKKKETRKKPTSRFLKKTDNTRRKER